MPSFFEQIWDQVVEYWSDLSRRNQLIFTLILIATFSIIGIVMYFSFQPQWVPLYNRDLDMKEASKIAEELDSMDVNYKLSGSVIEVPFSEVDQRRMQLAQSGVLPKSTVGFEIFEKGGIGITNFERQVRYKRALQGSLTRSITTNPKIEEASVNLALPQEKALFKSEEKPIKASVKLKLSSYSNLEKQAVKGIVNLVSYGVVGLQKENIVIMDQNDRILSDFSDEDGTSGKQAQQLQVKKRIEEKLASKVRQSLGKVLTRERLAVAVTVDMDFDRVEKTMKEYRQPEGAFEQLMKREESKTRDLQGKDVQPGGKAGASSNIPGAESMEEGKLTKYNEDKSMVEYYADKNVTKIVKDPAVTRVSTVVSVDGRYETEINEEGEIVDNYEKPSDEKLDKIKQMARAAVGYKKDRDQIEVSYLKFDRGQERRKQIEKKRQEAWQRKVIYFAVIALGVTFFISGALLLWQHSRQEQVEEEVVGPPEEEPEMPTRDLMAEVSVEEQEEERMTDQVRETIDENPDTAAQVLRSWFADEI